MEIKWHDVDPVSGQRRFLCAERFAGVWRFRYKYQRRGEWTRGLEPTRAMWEHILDGLERRLVRREGVEEEDVDEVRRILNEVVRLEEQGVARPMLHLPKELRGLVRFEA